jgi:leader peptidase (prepilin peptidase)/N-methyltransferase
MTFQLPHQDAAWWAILVLGLLGAGVGAAMSRLLAAARYRRPAEWARPLPRHLWWLVIAVAAAWASMTFRLGDYANWSLLPAYLYLGVVGSVLTLIDLDVHRLPDLIVLPSYPVAFVLLLVPTVVTEQWGWLLRAVLAALFLFVTYLVLALASPGGGGLGYGDVKLAGVLGLLLGWLGWGPVIISILVAFVIGGISALTLLVTGRAGRTSRFAFGPSMILGAWVALMSVHFMTG